MLKRIVIKVGSSTLAYQNGKTNLRRVEKLACILTDIRNSGVEAVLVTSGAIAAGMERLGLTERPRDTKGEQAASAVGQAVLMQIYQNFFGMYNQQVAQILLTKDVIDHPTRRENAHNTFETLIDMGILPIVNENDTVSTEELGFNDNDTLSAYVARLVGADLLIILTDQDGLYTANPDKDANAVLIKQVDEITDEIAALGGESFGNLGTGGMSTKIEAARFATKYGVETVLINGSTPENLYRVLDGEEIGTRFKAAKID